MSKNLDRREFTKRMAAAAVGGVVASTVRGDGQSVDGAQEMPTNRLLLLGLNALARAHQLDYFADGHRGAAMVAAHYLCVDNGLNQRARARIAHLIDKNWSSTPLCAPFPDETPQPERVKEIGEALAEGGEVLRQVGHNAIFAMLAIKGFAALPSAATPRRIEGVCAMIRAFTPWRDVEPDADVNPPPFEDAPAASKFILREASAAINRFIGFGQGYAGHMLTFGQALVELAAMGHRDWANSCRTAFRKYVTVTRRGPEPDSKRYVDHKPTDLRPIDAKYWERRGENTLGIGHVFKYPYSYYDLLRRADDEQLSRELDAKAYHVF